MDDDNGVDENGKKKPVEEPDLVVDPGDVTPLVDESEEG